MANIAAATDALFEIRKESLQTEHKFLFGKDAVI